jgi:phospholipid/cholesterol/gamma-HCH transport system permease protein
MGFFSEKFLKSKLIDIFFSCGSTAIFFFRTLESISLLSASTFYWIFVAPFRDKTVHKEQVVNQMVFIGVKSVFIIILVSCFLGMIIAMQTAYILGKFDAVMYTGSLVGVSFTRELGPLITAIVISGRVGAAMAAEIGTMKVSEEIEALEVMGINPVRFLVAPKVLAILIMVPCLTIIADMVGIFGGFIIGVANLNLTPGIYINKTIDALVHKDIITGLVKSVFFAYIIGIIGCYQGLIVSDGAEGVGKATTMAVVLSIVLVVIADCFFTALFYFVF